MTTRRFEQLAEGLVHRDRELLGRLPKMQSELEGLRARAEHCVGAFCRAVTDRGAAHLADVHVGPVEPDEKRVGSLQFKVRRGRWEIVCVVKPRQAVVLVGPYRQGKPERPCQEHPLPSRAAEDALDELLLRFLCEASSV